MPAWNADDYEPVEERLRKFWADHPLGRITTELLRYEDPIVIVRAEVHRDEDCAASATGYAQETIGQGVVNKTSALENCETSAIGRALANLGYAAKSRPSREEMAKTSPVTMGGTGGTKEGEPAGTYGEGGPAGTPPDDDPLAAHWARLIELCDGDKAKARRTITKAVKRTAPVTARTDHEVTLEELEVAEAFLAEAS